jgi:hypothetical protein
MNDRHQLWFEALARDPDAFDRWSREDFDRYCTEVDDEIRADGEDRVPLIWMLTAYIVVVALVAVGLVFF